MGGLIVGKQIRIGIHDIKSDKSVVRNSVAVYIRASSTSVYVLVPTDKNATPYNSRIITRGWASNHFFVMFSCCFLFRFHPSRSPTSHYLHHHHRHLLLENNNENHHRR